jgi:hypothetical protein
MNDLSNKYALAALRERRAAMAGEITLAERKLRHLRETIVHIDATLRLFDPDADPTTIANKRPYKRVKLFGAGKLNRLILDALRAGVVPMTLPEIVGSIVATLGYGEDAAKGMTNRVRANLLYLTKVSELTVKTGDRATARWGLKE